MNFSQLELLRLLPETQFNLSKAADKVNIVQSAASRHIQLLEEELGSPLLERHGKKILGFTPLGERVMQEIEGIDLAKRNIKPSPTITKPTATVRCTSPPRTPKLNICCRNRSANFASNFPA